MFNNIFFAFNGKILWAYIYIVKATLWLTILFIGTLCQYAYTYTYIMWKKKSAMSSKKLLSVPHPHIYIETYKQKSVIEK